MNYVLTIIIFVSIFSGCISQPTTSETLVPTVIPTIIPTVIPTATTMVEDWPQAYASTSELIYMESSTENITIYVPVLLDENKNVLKMYDTPVITGNITTAIVDTEHGKALKISKSGLGNYLFNWNEVPGKDTELFVNWIKNQGYTQKGEELEITKTDNGTSITISGRITSSERKIFIVRLNEENILELYDFYENNKQKIVGWNLFFAKEENGNLNIYTGNINLDINVSHEKLKADEQIFDEFFSRFTISMSNYEPPEHFIDMTESPPKIDAWVYSDSDIEKVRFYFAIDPKTALYKSESFSAGITLAISTQGWVHLRKGWQIVNISLGKIAWDAVPAPTT